MHATPSSRKRPGHECSAALGLAGSKRPCPHRPQGSGFLARTLGRWLLLIAICAAADASAQGVQFRTYNTEGRRPAPPTIIAIDGVRPSVPYQALLDGLASADLDTRERAATQLFQQRQQYQYDLDLLAPFLADNSDRVLEYITSEMLNVVNTRPYKQPSLAAYAAKIHGVSGRTHDPLVRANCIGLLSLAATRFADVEPIVLGAVDAGSVPELDNAISSVRYFAPPSIEAFSHLGQRVTQLDKNNSWLAASIAEAMTSIANAVRNSSETYYADRLRDGSKALRSVVGLEAQAAFIDGVASSIRSGVPANSHRPHSTFSLDASLDPSVFCAGPLKINDREVAAADIRRKAGSVDFLGNGPPFTDGLNLIEQGRIKYTVWVEDFNVKRFDHPYHDSYAIIAAIDDYQLIAGGHTPYKHLGQMVANAQKLVDRLMMMGFQRDHIMTFYNMSATSKNLDDALKQFWIGGKYAAADRLVFYFGGHGDHVEPAGGGGEPLQRTGFLVTADYDPLRPTANTLLMHDLTGRHFENIQSRHALMLIDSCGETWPGALYGRRM